MSWKSFGCSINMHLCVIFSPPLHYIFFRSWLFHPNRQQFPFHISFWEHFSSSNEHKYTESHKYTTHIVLIGMTKSQHRFFCAIIYAFCLLSSLEESLTCFFYRIWWYRKKVSLVKDGCRWMVCKILRRFLFCLCRTWVNIYTMLIWFNRLFCYYYKGISPKLVQRVWILRQNTKCTREGNASDNLFGLFGPVSVKTNFPLFILNQVQMVHSAGVYNKCDTIRYDVSVQRNMVHGVQLYHIPQCIWKRKSLL